MRARLQGLEFRVCRASFCGESAKIAGAQEKVWVPFNKRNLISLNFSMDGTTCT